MKLENKVVLITGASRGLGKAVALRLAKEKAKLALIARTEKDLKAVKKEIESLGSYCEYFLCDVSDEKQVKKAFENIVKNFKKIDVLINNAGIWYQGPTMDHTCQKVKQLFEVNVIGMIYCSREVIPIMKIESGGQILNVISGAGLHPSGEWGVYTGTKYAERGFTDSLKEELKGTGIKVMSFYPSGMDTNLFIDAGFNKKSEPWMMKVEDVVEVILFMLTRPSDVVIEDLSLRKYS